MSKMTNLEETLWIQKLKTVLYANNPHKNNDNISNEGLPKLSNFIRLTLIMLQRTNND
jgi:hypothetical protein